MFRQPSGLSPLPDISLADVATQKLYDQVVRHNPLDPEGFAMSLPANDPMRVAYLSYSRGY